MPIDIASGEVELSREDFHLRGRVPLRWVREYRSALPSAPGGLGPGWTASMLASLGRDGVHWCFVDGHGDTHLFEDPQALLLRGEVLRLPGAFLALERRGDLLVVTRWDVETRAVDHYLFASRRQPGALDLVEIRNPSGDGIELLRDTAGRLARLHQRSENRWIELHHSQAGRIESASLVADGRVMLLAGYEYDAQGRLSAAFDANGFADRYTYDTHARLAREIVKDGAVYAYRYDGQGRCVHFAGLDGCGEKRLRFADAVHRTLMTNSLGYTRVFQKSPTGQILSEANASGGIRRTVYDAFNRIVATIEPSGAETRYGYDADGNRDSVTDALGNTARLAFNAQHQLVSITNALGHAWRFTYDGNARLVASEDPLGARWTFAYDEAGNPVWITDPNGARRRQSFENGLMVEASDWIGHVIRWRHDACGRVVERLDAVGARTTFQYDASGQLVGAVLPDGGAFRAGYDAAGNFTSLTNAKGDTVRWRYGTSARVLERADPLGGMVRYAWGTEPGHLDAVVNAEGERFVFERNAEGRVAREHGFDGRIHAFDYDADGRCIALTNGNGERIAFERDALGRLVRKTLADGSVHEYGYDAAGRLVSAVNADCSVAFEYDAAGRLTREFQGEHWVETEYDAAGEVVGIRSSLGAAVRYTLDGNGRVVRLVASGAHVLCFERDARGLETGRRMPEGFGLEQHFDPVGRMQAQHASRATASAEPGRGAARVATWQRRYRYDTDGLLQGFDDGVSAAPATTTYAHDAAERLVAADHGRGLREWFDYDANGNLVAALRQAEESETRRAMEYGHGNRLLACDDLRYDHDAEGRLVRKARFRGAAQPPEVWHYGWDDLGQLRSVERPDGATWHYSYDALGRRISKTGPEGTQRFLWQRDAVLHEVPGSGAPVTWVGEPGSFVPALRLEGDLAFALVCDHLGTPQAMFDAAGKAVWDLDLGAWGEAEPPRPSAQDAKGAACPIRFQGQWFDAESGLHYNRFRYYDPQLARFISPDPIGSRGEANVFAYVRSPTQMVDLLGLTPAPPPSAMSNDYDGNPVASWSDQPKSRVEFHQDGSELVVAYVKRGDGPMHADDMVVAAHAAAGLPPPDSVVLKNVINEPTNTALAAGVPPRDTLLGKLGRRIAASLGIQDPQVTVEERRGQTCIVVK